MRRVVVLLGIIFLVSAHGYAYVVNDLGDDPDATPGDNVCATAGAVCTLRAAIMEANAHAGPDPITFGVAGTISPGTPYPSITQQTSIDGTTAPGYAGAPVVIVDGAFSVNIGFDFGAAATNSLLAGLTVYGFSEAAVISSAAGVVIRNNYLGPIPAGTPNQDGIQLFGDGTTVGGADGTGNVISGNTRHGILAAGSGHVISDNVIGLNAAGTQPMGNGEDGVHLFSNATNITVGSLVAAERNVISGNGDDGVHVEMSTFITIRGNFIGTDGTGTMGISNGASGVVIDGSSDNTIGGAGATARNIISGNFDSGVHIQSGSDNLVAANYIGTDVTGTIAIPNTDGVLVESDAPGNIIGNSTAGNVISGNNDDGVEISGAADTVVRNNIIGLDPTGAAALGNVAAGVNAVATGNLEVGGLGLNERNVISANGVGVAFLVLDNSRILNNIIGLNAAGTATFGNPGGGVVMLSVSNVTVAGNTISGNDAGGIGMFGGGVSTIENNRIGTNPAGTAPFGNNGTGIELLGTNDVVIRGNVVGANAGHGIEVTAGAIGTIMHSNFSGISADLLVSMPNGIDGINVCDGAQDTVVGSVLLGGNVIANNTENGIGVEPTALLNNTWAANRIFNNTLLGIDLSAPGGVTPNDPTDEDLGPNNHQNFPTPTLAVTTPTASLIQGTINTNPNTAITLHFYSSVAADPSGFGEGQTYLGTTNVMTDVAGDAPFTFNGPALTAGHFVTGTATSASGTSEFSLALEVEAAPTVQFAVHTFATNENIGTVDITVTRTGELGVTSTVQYATSNNTAIAGADYTAAAGTITFNPGESSKTFPIPITNDTLDEPMELVNLTLSAPTMATLGATPSAVLQILDDDLPPTISINDVPLAEGNAGTTNFIFTLTLSAVSGFPVQVLYNTADGTATTGSDFAATGGAATIPAGNLTTTITVPVTGDVTFEPDETFVVNLADPMNASIADGQGLGTIQNDEGVPTLIISDVTLPEGNAGPTNFTFTVTISAPSATPVTFNYATADGTATILGSDYAAAAGIGTIPANAPSTTITVTVNGDTTFEPTETFFVNLSGASGAAISDNQGLGTITNDEGVPTLLISDVTLPEGNAGPANFTFTVTISAPSATPVTFNYATADGTATVVGSDYAAAAGIGTIPANAPSTTITVTVNGDTTFEPTETFFVNLSGASGATISDNQGLGTITNDDVLAVANLGVTKSASSPTFTPGQTITYTITVSNAGPATATGVTVTDTLPAGTTFQSVASGGANCTGTTTVTCTIPTLGTVTPVVITLVVTASGNAPIINTATVAGIETDPTPGNNAGASTINPAVGEAAIPTLSTWMLLLMALALGVVAMRKF